METFQFARELMEIEPVSMDSSAGRLGRDLRQPDVGRAGPVNAHVVRRAAAAFDIEDQRTRGVRRDRMRVFRRRDVEAACGIGPGSCGLV
jgi:hypothetical protein